MVEPVSYSAGKARLQRAGGENTNPTGSAANGASAPSRIANASAPASAAEMVSISAAAKGLPSELKAGPPIDIESVDRIRVAISENRYPIDLKAITESLFQSFLEISR